VFEEPVTSLWLPPQLLNLLRKLRDAPEPVSKTELDQEVDRATLSLPPGRPLGPEDETLGLDNAHGLGPPAAHRDHPATTRVSVLNLSTEAIRITR
jgi:hypothetical protein